MTDLSGNHVSNVWREGEFIYKRQPKYLCDNEWYAYVLLGGTGFVPEGSVREDEETIRMQYVVQQPVTNKELFIRRCRYFQSVLHKRSIRHGDLTRPHIFSVGNCPVVIDWAESRTWNDPRPDKRCEGDGYWLWRTVEEILAEQNL